MNETIERSQTHATFVIERSYPAPVETVWHALSDNEARDQWFGGGSAFDAHEKSHDFRVGGHGRPRKGSGTVARRRASSRPTPTSSTCSGSSSRTTCGSTSGTCRRP